MSDPVRITSLELENVKKVRMVRLAPSEKGLTVIGGGNRAGKTSVLDGICYALGGEKFRPSDLQNSEGLNPARMEVRLSNGLVVVREGRNASLKVTDPSGRKGGQKLLDSFVSVFALNLPAFMNAKTADKAKALLDTLGIGETLEALDREEKKWYDERTLAGREADRKKKYAEGLPEFPDAPDEPMEASEMSARLTAALQRNAERAARRRQVDLLKDKAAQAAGRLNDIERRIMDLKEEADRARAAKKEADEAVKDAETHPVEADEDTTVLNAELKRIDEINGRVRVNMEKHNAMDEAKHASEEYDALTAKVEDVRKRRLELLKSVDMPLEGLSVADGELVYGGRKWDCMSTMEQMKVSVAVCRAMKPECGFCLVDRLESFDLRELKDFAEWAGLEGLQVIGTRVSDGGECTIVIEDGTVKGAAEWDEPEPEKEAEPAKADDEVDF